jgi:hypothetical protein
MNFDKLKFEQVAIHVPDMEVALKNQADKIGLKNWVTDTVIGRVSVFGSPFERSVAKLAFNYDSCYEYELLHYVSGPNWHSAKNRNMNEYFFSHKSIHVDDMESAKKHFSEIGFVIAQEMFTEEHTNPYLIKQKRKYHYTIFDTDKIIGFDLKLIKRIEA